MNKFLRSGSLLALSVLLVVATSADAKTVSSKRDSKKAAVLSKQDFEPQQENAFLRLAKSLAFEALTEFKESSRRNPKYAMYLANLTNLVNATRNFNSTDGLQGIMLDGLFGNGTGISIPVQITLGLKSAIIGGLIGIKSLIINILLILLWIAFMVSGTAFFVCNSGLVSCGQAGGAGGFLSGLGGAGAAAPSDPSQPYGTGAGSGFTNPLNFFSSRSGVAQEKAQPIYNAIDQGYKKYQ